MIRLTFHIYEEFVTNPPICILELMFGMSQELVDKIPIYYVCMLEFTFAIRQELVGDENVLV